MNDSKILLTGATGFIGFTILTRLINAGYSFIRVVIRDATKQRTLMEDLRLDQYKAPGNLSFIVIPDFTKASAWGTALKDITHVIHTASSLPYPHLDPMRDIYEPNVAIQDALLAAAEQCSTLKRVVLTSSIVAAMPPLPRTSPVVYTADQRLATPTPPFTDIPNAYQAAKIRCLNSSRDLREKPGTRFEVVNVLPGYVMGAVAGAREAGEMATSSNSILLNIVTGMHYPSDVKLSGAAAHVDDVAAVHVKALEDSILGNKDYAVATPMRWNDVISVSKEQFPKAFLGGWLQEGRVETRETEWDVSETEKVFEMKFKEFGDCVKDTVGQYLELLRKEREEDEKEACVVI